MIIAIFSRGMVTNLTTTAYTPRPPDLYPRATASNAYSGIAGNSVLGAVGGEEMTPAATAAPAIAPPAARLPGRWTPRDAMCVVDDYCVAGFGLAPALPCGADGEIIGGEWDARNPRGDELGREVGCGREGFDALNENARGARLVFAFGVSFFSPLHTHNQRNGVKSRVVYRTSSGTTSPSRTTHAQIITVWCVHGLAHAHARPPLLGTAQPRHSQPTGDDE